MSLSNKVKQKIRANYYGPFEFFRDFSTEQDCEEHLMKLKYPQGYRCKRCGGSEFYKLKGKPKRARILECQKCKKQESITANTIFEKTRTPLQKWFYVMFSMSQSKKGKSASQLSKEIHTDEATVLLMMSKIRKAMEEEMVLHQIGGENCVVEADEIEIGGKNSKKQTVLALLEKSPAGRKGRLRLVPVANRKADTIEKALIPLIKKGSILHTDGNPVYSLLSRRYPAYFTLKTVNHWEENFRHEFLKDINMLVGNLKRWYRGIYHVFSPKNTGFYCNEFTYRFNRRRSETNILFKLIARSVQRPKILHYKEFSDTTEYMPLAS